MRDVRWEMRGGAGEHSRAWCGVGFGGVRIGEVETVNLIFPGWKTRKMETP